MAISKFENGHYRPKSVWVPYDGQDYRVVFDDQPVEPEAIRVFVRYHQRHRGIVSGTRAVRRDLNINGPRAQAVIDIARKIRAGEIVV